MLLSMSRSASRSRLPDSARVRKCHHFDHRKTPSLLKRSENVTSHRAALWCSAPIRGTRQASTGDISGQILHIANFLAVISYLPCI